MHTVFEKQKNLTSYFLQHLQSNMFKYETLFGIMEVPSL